MNMRKSAGRRRRSERKKKKSGGQNWREQEGSKVFVVGVSVWQWLPLCFRRQDELEARLIEEETAKRVEEELAKRVQQLLYERKDEIEAEVLRRVEEAKKVGAFEGVVGGGACHAYEEVLLTPGSVSFLVGQQQQTNKLKNNGNNRDTKSVGNNGLVHFWCKLVMHVAQEHASNSLDLYLSIILLISILHSLFKAQKTHLLSSSY